MAPMEPVTFLPFLKRESGRQGYRRERTTRVSLASSSPRARPLSSNMTSSPSFSDVSGCHPRPARPAREGQVADEAVIDSRGGRDGAPRLQRRRGLTEPVRQVGQAEGCRNAAAVTGQRASVFRRWAAVFPKIEGTPVRHCPTRSWLLNGVAFVALEEAGRRHGRAKTARSSSVWAFWRSRGAQSEIRTFVELKSGKCKEIVFRRLLEVDLRLAEEDISRLSNRGSGSSGGNLGRR